MKRSKFKWNIYIEADYMNTGKEYLVINLNGGLNSAIPTASPEVENFKEEKLAEIKIFEGENVSHIPGIELLMK